MAGLIHSVHSWTHTLCEKDVTFFWRISHCIHTKTTQMWVSAISSKVDSYEHLPPTPTGFYASPNSSYYSHCQKSFHIQLQCSQLITWSTLISSQFTENLQELLSFKYKSPLRCSSPTDINFKGPVSVNASPSCNTSLRTNDEQHFPQKF